MERMKEAKAGKEGSQGRKKNDISRRAKEGNRKGRKRGKMEIYELLEEDEYMISMKSAIK